MAADMVQVDKGSAKASHLVVLVHGLWGKPAHMSTIAEQLREKYSSDELRILVASSNVGYTTYDGVDVGGERVAAEIELELAAVEAEGGQIKRFSILGYSLGGLISRYCVGLLYARGLFEPGKLEPVQFTTFASPWLGVRAPMRWVGTGVWNFLGSRTLSTSGKQMFLTDDFKKTGRPLLAIMADSSSVFYKGLAAFKKRIVYCNIVNDRSTPFYTTSIGSVDPFVDPEAAKVTYVDGYEPTLIDFSKPITKKVQSKSTYDQVVGTSYKMLTRLPLVTLIVAMLPITATIFLTNAGYQTLRSSGRIKAHGLAGQFSHYRIPLMLEQALDRADGMAAPQYLDEDEAAEAESEAEVASNVKANGELKASSEKHSEVTRKHREISEDFPTLALAPEQFSMIQSLNDLGIKKYGVHIQLVGHSHAAIVVRWKKDGFKEGYTVIKHWLNEEFEL